MRPLLKLNPYFRRYRGRILLGVLFIALSNVFAVYSPQVVREAFDLIAAGLALLERGDMAGQLLQHGEGRFEAEVRKKAEPISAEETN